MKPHKILFLIDHLGSGGAQRQIVNLAIGMKQLGYHVEMAIYYPQFDHFNSLVTNAGIRINTLKKTRTYSVKVILELMQLVKKKQFELIISFLDTPNVYAEMVRKFYGTRCIVSERIGFPPVSEIPYRRKVQCRLHRFSDRIVSNSYYHEERLLQLFPKLKEKSEVIYNIVDRSFFDIAKNRKSDKDNHFLCVGTVNKRKNATVVINALHSLKMEYGVEARVSWAGKIGKMPEDVDYFETCQQLIKKFQLENQWKWLGECKDMISVYKKYDILLLPSFLEGLPNAVCEAMAAGLAVMASDVCEHPRLLSDWGNKLLFDPHKPDDLVEKMLGIMRMTKGEKESIRAAMHEKAKLLFNKERIVARFNHIVKGIL